MQSNVPSDHLEIDPVETFLRTVICVDKLALYQPIIDILKVNEKFSVLDALNSLINVSDDVSPATLVDEIHDTFIKYLIQLIAEFDVVVVSDDLPMLFKLYQSLTILDSYDEHNYIVNICADRSLTPLDQLYQLVNIIHRIDEYTFTEAVKLCSMTLIQRIHDIHFDALNRMEDETVIDYDRERLVSLRKLVAQNKRLIVLDIIEDHGVRPGLSPNTLTNLATSRFYEYDVKDVRRFAVELIALYLYSDASMSELIKVIQKEVHGLISDPVIIHHLTAVLPSVFSEIQSNG